MTSKHSIELIDKFEDFYRTHYHDEITALAQKYPSEQKSLYIDWQDLAQFDTSLADDFRNKPAQLRECAEKALRLDDLLVDVSLGQANVRIRNLPETRKISDLGAEYNGNLVQIKAVIRSLSDIEVKPTTAAFECQRCGTVSRIPQNSGELQEPYECYGCERQGPFQINYDQSELIDEQEAEIYDSHAIQGQANLELMTITLEDDLTGQFVPGEEYKITAEVTFRQTDQNVFQLKLDIVGIQSTEESCIGPLITDEHGNPSEQSGDTKEPSYHPGIRLAVPAQSVEDNEWISYTVAANTVLSTHSKTNLDEERTKAKLITPFLEALGWIKYNQEEWEMEYTESTARSQPDYALFGPKSERPDIVVEAKRLNKRLVKSHRSQLYEYLRVFGCNWGLLTNGQSHEIYYNGDFSEEIDTPFQVAKFAISDFPQQFPEALYPLTRDYQYKLAKTERENSTGAYFHQLLEHLLEDRNSLDSELAENLLSIVAVVENQHTNGAPIDEVIERAKYQYGANSKEAKEAVDLLKQQGKVYESQPDRLQSI